LKKSWKKLQKITYKLNNNMTTSEQIKPLIPQGETTTVQFKVRSEDAYKMGVEMVAFSNTQGGILIVGVDDKTGIISGLSFEEIQQTNTLLVKSNEAIDDAINFGVNEDTPKNERVNIENERVNSIFERVNIKNERVKNELMRIYSFIEQNPLVKIEIIEKFNKKSKITNKRYIKILKDNRLIEYIGSDKTGGYRIT